MTLDLRAGAAAVALLGLAGACASGETPANPPMATSIENSCINPTEITRQTIVSDQEIRFELRNGEVWVNRLPRTCPGLRSQGGFNWEVRGTLVCSNQQTIYVKDEGTPCLLGEFARLPATPG